MWTWEKETDESKKKPKPHPFHSLEPVHGTSHQLFLKENEKQV